VARVEVKFEGLKEVERLCKKIGQEDLYYTTMDDLTLNAYLQAKFDLEKGVPVDTGTLRESIKLKQGKGKWKIWCDSRIAPYAVFNEYGLSPQTPLGPGKYCGYRPFLRPAINQAMKDLNKIFDKNWKKWVKSL